VLAKTILSNNDVCIIAQEVDEEHHVFVKRVATY